MVGAHRGARGVRVRARRRQSPRAAVAGCPASSCSAASPSSTAAALARTTGRPRIIWAKERGRPARTTTRSGTPSRASPSTATASADAPVRLGHEPDAARRRARSSSAAWSSTARPAPCSPRTRATRRRPTSSATTSPTCAHYLAPDADVLVIGVGGGRDVLSALEFDQKSVTGVEINGDILDITNERVRRLHRPPRPRSARQVRQRRGAQLPRPHRRSVRHHPDLAHRHVGGHVGRRLRAQRELALHDRGLGHLPRPAEPDGVLSVSRWYHDRPAGASRSRPTARSALAAQALKDAASTTRATTCSLYTAPPTGVRQRRSATMLVSPRAVLGAADVATMDAQAARLEFTPVLTADDAIDDDVRALASPGGPGRGGRRLRRGHLAAHRRPAVLLPDGRPRHAALRARRLRATTTHAAGARARPARADRARASPIGVHRRAAAPHHRARRAHRGMRPFYTYFAGIGLGLPAGRDLAAPAAQHLPRPPDLRADRRAVLAARLQRHREHGHRADRATRTSDRRRSLALLVLLARGVAAFGVITPA